MANSESVAIIRTRQKLPCPAVAIETSVSFLDRISRIYRKSDAQKAKLFGPAQRKKRCNAILTRVGLEPTRISPLVNSGRYPNQRSLLPETSAITTRPPRLRIAENEWKSIQYNGCQSFCHCPSLVVRTPTSFHTCLQYPEKTMTLGFTEYLELLARSIGWVIIHLPRRRYAYAVGGKQDASWANQPATKFRGRNNRTSTSTPLILSNHNLRQCTIGSHRTTKMKPLPYLVWGALFSNNYRGRLRSPQRLHETCGSTRLECHGIDPTVALPRGDATVLDCATSTSESLSLPCLTECRSPHVFHVGSIFPVDAHRRGFVDSRCWEHEFKTRLPSSYSGNNERCLFCPFLLAFFQSQLSHLFRSLLSQSRGVFVHNLHCPICIVC